MPESVLDLPHPPDSRSRSGPLSTHLSRMSRISAPTGPQGLAQELRRSITLLLEFYREVEEGNLVFVEAERRAGDASYGRYGAEDLPTLRRFRRAWSHMSYRQLERLLARLRSEQPFLWLHVRRRYFDYREVRRSRCPRCGEHPATHVGRVHPGCKVREGRRIRSAELVPVVVRVYPEGLDAARLEAALDWLQAEWRGPCDVPALVGEITREQALRACA